MALLESGRPPRDILPPINHPDFEKSRPEKHELSRLSMMPGLNISSAPLGSPTTIYSGPPPPYSCASSTTESAHGFNGYFSPSEPHTRQSTRDDHDAQSVNRTHQSLPSLHEALGVDKAASFTGPTSTAQTHGANSTPTTSIGQSFPDAPPGPPNPFSHPALPSSNQSNHFSAESVALKAVPGSSFPSETAGYVSQSLSSPHTGTATHDSTRGSFSSINRRHDSSTITSPYSTGPSTQNNLYSEYTSQPSGPQTSGTFSFEPSVKFDDTRNPFLRTDSSVPYGETVKRHLEVFDAELALQEVNEASSRMNEFSRMWTQRYHSGNRSNYFAENGPSIGEIDDMTRQQHRILDSLSRMREVVVMQQNALSEQRARAARGLRDDEYQGMHDEYKSGGFTGGDAKKRRGKAAPPGRCHSCNRAETPEWRRGPDGARTLCNACGLHYAKLTRKLGVNKASALTGSSLRPKSLDPRSAHS